MLTHYGITAILLKGAKVVPASTVTTSGRQMELVGIIAQWWLKQMQREMCNRESIAGI